MNRLCVVSLIMLFAAPAAADTAVPTKQECVAANEAAQDLRRAGKLRDARKKLELCVAEICPKAVREDCAQRLDDLDKAARENQPETSDKTVVAQSALGADGDTCSKRSDCAVGLRCHNEKCAKPSEDDAEPQRTFGFGFGFGGGISAGTLHTIKRLDEADATPEVILGTFEFSWYLPGEHAANLYVPLVNNVIGSLAVGGFVWNMDLVFTFNIGKGNVRFVAGPGVGFTVLAATTLFSNGAHATGGGLRIPGELAVEILTAKHTDGVKFALRPWIEISTERYDYPGVLLSGANVNATGGGVIGMITFTRFSLRESDTP